jgi:uncharacterized protein (UPF0303 family)
VSDAAADIARIAEQERRLVFPRFDEHAAFALGSAIRTRAAEAAWPIVVEIRLWDRPLFFAALPGSAGNNAEWARRKFNTVRATLKSSLRCVLEHGSPADRSFKPSWAMPLADYVLAGGGFPLTVEGAGVIGAILVSGLPERDDHGVIVEALCARLGVPHEEVQLGA